MVVLSLRSKRKNDQVSRASNQRARLQSTSSGSFDFRLCARNDGARINRRLNVASGDDARDQTPVTETFRTI